MSEPGASVRLPGATRRDVAVEGVRLSVHRADPPRRRRTTPVLLLHGVPQTALVWRHLVPDLATDRVVLAPDLKGLGASEVRGPYDVPTLVAELAALVLHEVDQRVDVVGHDWGGTLGAALAAARPDLVRRLVVCAAPYRTLSLRHAWHVPLFALPVVPEVLFTVAGSSAVPAMIRAAWRASPSLEADALDHYVAAYRHPDRIGAMLGYYRAVMRHRVGRLVRSAGGEPGGYGSRRVPAPERTLVVWGEHDPVLPVWVGEALGRDVAGSVSMSVVPGVGHFVPEEAPDVFVREVGEFLRAPAA